MGRRGERNGSLTLREQALEQLRAALLGGELQPDVTYSVPALTEEFGVSATPIREAILDLAKEGLIVTVPNRGFRVVKASPETVAQVAAVRKLIEVPATVAVAASLTESDLHTLLALAKNVKSYAVKKDMRSYLRADRKFHESIMQFTGNPVLVELSESLRAKARLHALPSVVATGKLVESADEHLALVEAMRAGDNDAIRTISSHHIDYAVRSLAAMGDGGTL